MDIATFAEKFGSLFIRSKFLVDGLYQGRHRSITPGYSVEFTEHRPYEAGDDIRFIDWKVYAKTDRFMVKKFTEETELDAYLFLDTSGSMGYEDKFHNSILLAGTLLYLFHMQKDRVSLFTTSSFFIPPTRRKDELMEMFSYLESSRPEGDFDAENILMSFSKVIKKRGFVILISDFLFQFEYLDNFLRFMRKKHRQVIGFWILSEKERKFPFKTGAYFKSIEDASKMKLDPEVERKVYLKKLKMHEDNLKEIFATNGGTLIIPSESETVEDALLKFLGGKR